MKKKVPDSRLSARKLREVLNWYIELPFSVDVDMDVVLHLIEQLENPEYHVNVELALARFKNRLAGNIS